MKKIMIVFALVLLIPIVSANLIIEPSSLDINAVLGSSFTKDIIINTSNMNSSLFNLSFSNINCLEFPKVVSISPDTLGSIGVEIEANSRDCSGSFTSIIKYFTGIETTREPETHIVEINENSFNPSSITIYQDDKISFLNNLDYTVIVEGEDFTFSVEPSSTSTQPFSEIGNQLVNLDTLGYWLSVSIDNKTGYEMVYDSANDIQMPVSINVFYNKTDISASLFDDNITLEYLKSTEVIMKVSNNGSYTAKGIKFSSDIWNPAFSKNNFDLDTGKETFVVITLTPELKNASETNNTYTSNIRISGDNFPDISLPITVFVPHEDYVINKTWTNEEVEELKRQMLDWINSIEVSECSGINYPDDYIIGVNYTSGEVHEKMGQYGSINENIVQVRSEQGKLREAYDSLLEMVSKMGENMSSMASNMEGVKVDSDEKSQAFKIGVIIIMLIILSGTLVFIISIHYKKKRREEW